jgi:hypothetical protein
MFKKCEVEDCNCEVYSNGGRWNSRPFSLSARYCRKHLRWLEQYGTLDAPKMAQGSLEFRFWKHVEKRGEDECWIWVGSSKNKKSGYGSFWDNETKRSLLAHRVSYLLFVGLIPQGKLVMHSCDNQKCVNPKHLSLGTHKLNGEDKAIKGRAARNAFFGENNPKSKLTAERVKFIREHPEIGHKQIADMWGLSPNCIRGVRIGRTWKEV